MQFGSLLCAGNTDSDDAILRWFFRRPGDGLIPRIGEAV